MEFIITTILSVIGNIFQYFQNRQQKKQFQQQLIPEIEAEYHYISDSDKHKLIIRNIGLVDCNNVWVDEKIYLIIEDRVFDGEDVPHYHYLINEGSRTRMWDIQKSQQIEVQIVDFQIAAFERLIEKFNPIIVSQWTISYSGKNSNKRFKYDKFFLFDAKERLFKNIESVVSGLSYLNNIKDYISIGPQKTVNIFQLTSDFEINAPNDFLINSDYSITPLYPWTRLSLKQLNEAQLIHNDLFSSPPTTDDSNDITIKYVWKLDKGNWSKSIKWWGEGSIYSGMIRPISYYLSQEDKILVEEKPKLLKFNNPNRKLKENPDTIMEKAKQKFISDHSN